MTCALKNCKGCLPDREKRRFHAEGLMEPIAALAAALRQALTIVDSICGDLDFEEGGNPVPTGRMLLGTDMVQIDAYGCRLMGLGPAQVPYIGLAERWGAGSSALAEGELVRLNAPTDGAEYPRPSGAVAALTRAVQARSACSACYASLVRALHRSGGTNKAVAIGQGWKGMPFDGLVWGLLRLQPGSRSRLPALRRRYPPGHGCLNSANGIYCPSVPRLKSFLPFC